MTTDVWNYAKDSRRAEMPFLYGKRSFFVDQVSYDVITRCVLRSRRAHPVEQFATGVLFLLTNVPRFKESLEGDEESWPTRLVFGDMGFAYSLQRKATPQSVFIHGCAWMLSNMLGFRVF